MATINLNDAMAWLKKMEERSNINRQRFEARPSVPASQAWSGYQDKPGGQRLMVRQMQRPEIDNTLTVKNDGTQTLVKKWKDPDQSNVKASALPREPVMGPGRPVPPPRNQRNPFDIPRYMFPQGAMSPEAQAAIAQVQATGGKNVDGYGNPIGPDLQNYRVMHNAMTKPNPQVVPSIFSIPQQTQRNIWGSRFVPNPAPMIRKERNAPPVGMDEEQWRFLLDRIYGGNN